MPPVFGPTSPSPSRLWSCEVASGRTCLPSAMTMKLASSPSRNSSTTTTRPASPKAPANMPSAARIASSALAAMITPLPAASPSALTTMGGRCARIARRIERLARECGIARRRDAVAHQEFLGELLAAFEPRRELSRPEAGQARGREGIDDAGDQRAFGSHDRESRRPRRAASATSPAISAADTVALRHFGSSAVPALPGATITSVTRGDCASFQASACSRPPPPMTRTFNVLNAGSGACR